MAGWGVIIQISYVNIPFLGGLCLHLLVEGLEVHALGLPELDLRHRTRVLVLIRVQQVGRVLAQDL